MTLQISAAGVSGNGRVKRRSNEFVTVVVPTCRRPELLSRCLQSLLAQSIDPSRYEVIVVDDSSSLETRELVAGFAAHPQLPQPEAQFAIPVAASSAQALEMVRSIPTSEPTRKSPKVRYIAAGQQRGPAAARNLGWRMASGEIIAFTDDDCVPDRDWLRNGLEHFTDGVMGVSGRVIVPLPAHPTDFERQTTGLERSEFVTANCFYRREALQAVGGFDERFTLAWREDSDLYFRLLEQGCRLVKAPDTLVIHPAREAPWGISLRLQRKSMYNALIYKKHPRRYRQKLQPHPPWIYYAVLVAGMVAAFAGFTHRSGLGLVAFGIWTALTLLFAFQRLRSTARTGRHIAEMLVTSVLIPPLCVFWRLRGAIKYRVFFL